MFKYNEELYAYRYYRKTYKTYKFRKDSVPFIRKPSCENYLKSPKMRKREMSLYSEYKKFIRLKRSRNNMPDSWDDILRSDCGNARCWKSKKIRKQWMKNQSQCSSTWQSS